MDIVLKSEHNEKATAGNTSRIVKGADKIMGEIAPAEPSFSAPDLCINKKHNPGFRLCFQNLYQTKRRKRFFQRRVFIYTLGLPLE